MKRLYLPIGISGSGKSTYLKKHFKPEVIVSPDNIRKQLTGNITNQSQDATIWKHMVPNQLNACLEKYGEAVLDATNTTSSGRMAILKLFGPDVRKIAIVFESNPETSKARIKKDLDLKIDRSAVPDEVVDRQYKNFINGFSNIEKQFDEVITIRQSLKENPDFLITPEANAKWSDKNAFAFGYYNNKLRVGDTKHSKLFSDVISKFVEENPNFFNDKDADDIFRQEISPSGRLWTNYKIISFWYYPLSSEDRKQFINDMNENYVMKHEGLYIDDTWKIEAEKEGKLISVLEFLKGYKLPTNNINTNISHALSPLKKPHRDIPSGLGSKKRKAGMSLSQYAMLKPGIAEQEELPDQQDIPPEIAKKSINDEFQVNGYALSKVQQALEKANKNLRSRHMKELELKILKTETITIKTDNEGGIEGQREVTLFTVKIDGDVPELHDYEFIAKVEHTDAGNIINMNPTIPPEKLPAEYKTYNQKCDICKTNRERNNTFIIKKLENNQFICAGSTCLKKFMPLDTVKAFLEYAIQLEILRGLLINAEASAEDDEERGGDGGSRGTEYLDPEKFLTYICIAYLSKNKMYISNTKAKELQDQGKYGESTLSVAQYLMHPGPPGAAEYERKRLEIINTYKKEATDMAKQIMEWMQEQDFDQMAFDNPNMETYFNNMKVLSKLPYITPRNTGYYSSFLALYLRATRPKKEPVPKKKESEYVGTIGEKIEILVELKSTYTFDGAYGTTTIFNFIDESGNRLVWFSTSFSEDLNKLMDLQGTGKKVKIKGTIKAQQINKKMGYKETVLTRVKITSMPASEPQQISEGFKQGERVWIMMSDNTSPYDSGIIKRYNEKAGEYEVQAENKGNIFLLYEKDLKPYTNETIVRRNFMKLSEIKTMVNEELNQIFGEQSSEMDKSYVSSKAGLTPHGMGGGYLITLPNNSDSILLLKQLRKIIGNTYDIRVRGRHSNRKDVLGAKYKPGTQNEVPIKLAEFWAVYLYPKQ